MTVDPDRVPQRYRDAAQAIATELAKSPAIPDARQATVAYYGRGTAGACRLFCVTCHDRYPLTDATRRFGDWFADPSETCDQCGVSVLDLTQRCQAEHDAQQAEWARHAAPTVLVEYGIPTAIRCRVY